MSYNFILDTSALGRKLLSAQVQTLIKRLRANSICSFYLTPTLLEERSNFITQPKSDWPRLGEDALQFLSELKTQRVFNQLGGRICN